ncbi:HAD family hydrolase [Pseudoxanthomonas sacheonensis]|uniref:HAD superfamily hydrolase (TIGR01509 family) n=1 Tax=Pseudoxanthomonas sacheonensis TaxID=443615 RepID=A0ABU1RU33_9GAMM|nr:HAD family phosphatase [Pseudoxanthomonas sacheonensis]MDR6841430.1 HAD superfamily hydrolase (TIGR01509 family) [Pseudoxanthomonas sacheonensis]
MSARAVIFDMDGLLIDSERVILECWRVTAAEQSLAVDDTLWLSMVGLHDAGSAELLSGLLGAERAERLTLECKRRYDLLVEEGLPLKAGARELLQDLFDLGVPLAVATSTRGERARLKLARSGIDGYFNHVVTSSDVAQAKPAPDLYLLAAERLGIPPRECIAIEDSEFGVRAASAAGMRVIQVPDLLPASETTLTLAKVVPDLDRARAWFQKWLNLESLDPSISLSP